jgi:hypothetical protein
MTSLSKGRPQGRECESEEEEEEELFVFNDSLGRPRALRAPAVEPGEIH